MVGCGRRLVELDDHVDSGAVLAAFQGVKVARNLMVLAIGKRQSRSKQGEQGQPGKAPAPSRCL